MTDQRTQFLIQVLDKIGGPLTAAVAAGPPVESDSIAAQRVAELLNRSVQLGLSVAGQMNVRTESQADGVHLSLTAFASPLMAGQYVVSGRVPDESEVKQITTALQAVLTFADNFTPAADSTLRLENTEAGAQPADEPLLLVQVLNAFVPVLQVVSEYSFGKPEPKMIQDIAARLMSHAADLREIMFGDSLPVKTSNLVDIVLMKMLCGLYAAAHGAETRRLMALPDHARTNIAISTDPVWASLDKQIAMVRVVAGQIVPDKGGEQEDADTASRKPVVVKAPAKEKDQKLPPAVAAMLGKQSNGPASSPPPVAAAASGNPMAFFAPGTKKTGESDTV